MSNSTAMLEPSIEAMSARELATLHQQAWPAQWEYVCGNSVFYQRKFGATVDTALPLSRIAELPLTEKDELRDSIEQCPPFGDYLACDPGRVVRLHRTSGTTGGPVNIAWTQQDAGVTARVGARAMFAAGLRPGDRVVHCLNYCLWTGGLTDHLALEAAGATVIPFGVGHTRQLLRTIAKLGVTAISCTPSYPALMEKVLTESGGRNPRELGLRLALFGGEGGLDNDEFRNRLEQTWGFQVRNANYGLSEVMSQFAGQCPITNDLHFHAGDVVFAELLDPDRGTTLPVEAGNRGELVLTNLRRQAQPLVRYRTGDIVTVTDTDPCQCGRTSWRFRIAGRTDDMFNVRGINVFPTAISEVLAAAGDLTSGQFRVTLRGPGPYDRIEMKVEAASSLGEREFDGASMALEQRVREHIGATAAVSMVPHMSLPRTDGKTSWIERTRE